MELIQKFKKNHFLSLNNTASIGGGYFNNERCRTNCFTRFIEHRRSQQSSKVSL